MRKIPLMALEGVILLVMGLTGVVQGIYLILRPDPFALYDRIGPGRSLIFISLVLMGAVIVHMICYRQTLHDEARTANWKGVTGRFGRATGLIAAYILLIDFVSLLPATLVFLVFTFKFMGVKSWLRSSILSIVLSISIYLLFVRALHMELPGGVFFE
jgi:putative tricarboxylic transport membrane protein